MIPLKDVQEAREWFDRWKRQCEEMALCVRQVMTELEEKKLAQDDLLEACIDCMTRQRSLQQNVTRQYAALFPGEEMPALLSEAEARLCALEAQCSASKRYSDAIRDFLRLRTDSPVPAGQLLRHQKELEKWGNPDQIDYGMYGSLFDPYLKLVESVRRSDKSDCNVIVKLVQDLTHDFENEIIAGVIGDGLYFADETEATEAAERTQETTETVEAAEAAETEDTEETENATEAEKAEKLPSEACSESVVTQTSVPTDEPLSQEVEPDDTDAGQKAWSFSADDFAFLEDVVLLIESSHTVSEPEWKTTQSKFGVKLFKSDMSGVFGSARKSVLKGIFQSGFALWEEDRPEENDEEIIKNQQLFKAQLDYLYNKGYLSRMVLDGTKTIYALTDKGCKAFTTQDSASFMGMRKCRDSFTEMPHTVWKALMTFWKARSCDYVVEKFGVDSFMEKRIDTKYAFALMTRSDNRFCLFVTILRMDAETYDSFFDDLRGYVEEGKEGSEFCCYVMGETHAHCDGLVDLLHKNGVEASFGRYVSVEDQWYRPDGNPFDPDSLKDSSSESEATEPETTEPETTEPEVTEPEATNPEATEPEATEPEVTEPEATNPEATEPEATEPETTEPEATEPETTEPEATEPEATEPEATEPEATEPEATEPEATEPEATEAEATEPEATEPEETEAEAAEPEEYEPEDMYVMVDDEDIPDDLPPAERYGEMLLADKLYCATAYLKSLARYDKKANLLYRQLAYAVNDPMGKCAYTSDVMMQTFFGEGGCGDESLLVSAMLRYLFMDHMPYDYNMKQLFSMTKDLPLMRENPGLQDVLSQVYSFKEEIHYGIDKFADYHIKEMDRREREIRKLQKEANQYYSTYIENHVVEKKSLRRLIEMYKLMFSDDGDISLYLSVVVTNDVSCLPDMKEFLLDQFIKDDAQVREVNIDDAKINEFIDLYWKKAESCVTLRQKSSKLVSSLRTNLFKKLEKIVRVLCRWVVLNDGYAVMEDNETLIQYNRTRKEILAGIREAIDGFITGDAERTPGECVLVYTLNELRLRLIGEYEEADRAYFYIDFLKSSHVLLDENRMPQLSPYTMGLDGYDIWDRILVHATEDNPTMMERMTQIIDGDDDLGSAMMLMEYAECKQYALSAVIGKWDIDEEMKRLDTRAQKVRDNFIGDLELVQSYGQLDNTSDDKKEQILRTVNEWFDICRKCHNYGFFTRITNTFMTQIRQESVERADMIRKELDEFIRNSDNDPEQQPFIQKIRESIDDMNYTVAEDMLNRLANGQTESDFTLFDKDYLADFLRSYEYTYRSVGDASVSIKKLTGFNKRERGGKRLIESWPSAGGYSEEKLRSLLGMLGFDVESVVTRPTYNKKEMYYVTLKKPINGRKSNFKHPIAAFGSEASQKRFRVICLFGHYKTESLLETFREIGNAAHTLVLLDYPLALAERRNLARQIKQNMHEAIFAVVDRVAIKYLADHYEETTINRMLMSLIMPFSYYQPYFTKAADPIPPEMFFGRENELSKIESAKGVNIVYGGRQLGKTALLRMAKNVIDHNENGDRAVLVDIKLLDYTKAARKVSQTLSDEGILQEDFETDDWNELARAIKRRLTTEKEPSIPYFLLLMDEADAFIDSCEAVKFAPFDALKDIQSVGEGRFKFVIAGLRNIARFKGDLAQKDNVGLPHLSWLTVKPLDFNEARKLLETPLYYLGMRFPKEQDSLVSMILAKTNYFPGLIHLYCSKLLESMKESGYAGYSQTKTPPYEIQEKHIKKVLADSEFQKDITNKFMITLKVDEDCYYHVIALVVAYLYYEKSGKSGYTPEDVMALADEFGLEKLTSLTLEQISALMEEMKEMNILRTTSTGNYLFARYNFFRMIGSKADVDDELMKYMEV